MDEIIKIEGNFISKIRQAGGSIVKAVQSSLRMSAKETEVEIHSVVTKKKLMNITFEDFRKTKTLMRSVNLKGDVDSMFVEIVVKGVPHTSYRFWPKSTPSRGRKLWFGYIYGKSKRFYGGKAFAIPGKKPLFVRSGSERFPVKPVFGPSVPSMLIKEGHDKTILNFAEETLIKRLSKSMGDDFPLG